jgi:hypothetical protein
MKMKTRKLAIVEEPRAPAPIKTKFEKLSWLVDDLERSAEYNLKKFQESFEKNPAYAFEWSAGAFDAAAEKQVAAIIKDVLSPDKEASEAERAEWILREALDRAMRGARNPARSTSAQSNEMEKSIASVWAKVYDKVERGMF